MIQTMYMPRYHALPTRDRARAATSSVAKRTPHTNPKHACPHLYKLPTVHCTSSTAGIMSHPWNRGPTPCRLPCGQPAFKVATASHICTSYPTRATPDAGQSPPQASTLATTASKSQGAQSRRGDRSNGERGPCPSLTETTTFPGPGGRLSACQALPS